MATARNTADITFDQSASGANGQVASHIGIWTAATGGTLVATHAVGTTPSGLALGERLQIAATSLTLTVPTGDFTSNMATRGINGLIAGTLHVSANTGTPATTANQITALDRESIASTAWTLA